MTSDERRALVGAALNVTVVGVALWYSLPGRPPLAPYLWRAGARGAQLLAHHAETVALYCRSRYWRAVRP